jgi:hypothetical protein
MSESDNLNGAVANPFQARFGVAAGTQAPDVERQQWEQLCRELMQERDRLRSELTQTQAKCDRYLIYLQAESQEDYIPTPEEAVALAAQQPTLEEVIAGVKKQFAHEPDEQTGGAPSQGSIGGK